MSNSNDEEVPDLPEQEYRDDLEVVEHDGEVNIYDDTNDLRWLRSDTSVADLLDETDSDVTALPSPEDEEGDDDE